MSSALIAVTEPRAGIRRLTSERFRRSQREAGRGAAAAEAFLQGKAIRQEILGLGEVEAEAPIAADLGVVTGDAVFVRRRRLLLEDGTPLQLADSYLPMVLATGRIREDDAGPGGTYARIEEQGHRLTSFRERFWYRAPTQVEAEQLALDGGEAVIELHRVAFAGDLAVECFVSVMAASRHMFEYDIDAG